MKIEDNYKDVVIYNVIFSVAQNKQINKTIILNATMDEITEERIEGIVLKTFKNVLEVIKVDEVMDGLLLRDTSPHHISER
ncbi:hypothetical protein [Carnobacterium maltaromaticum]|uniref:hypothetical protein n=1 Tax=Carnobacterium maltaromaticum TaxID=2751 RepID=UPI00295EE0A5|nr:hypothetical protein [Carnobacterium maltaromaticum]